MRTKMNDDDSLTIRDITMYYGGMMREYLAHHPDITKEERSDLLVWVNSGHSVHSNPWGLHDDQQNQKESDYIVAFRHIQSKKRH